MSSLIRLKPVNSPSGGLYPAYQFVIAGIARMNNSVLTVHKGRLRNKQRQHFEILHGQ